METNIKYTIVGFFVIMMITAIVLAIIWLSSGLSLERYSTYAIYMPESVSGLTVDSVVEFNGVDVGVVKSIKIDNPRLVEVLISIKSSTPITQGTLATLNQRGVTGLTYLALKDKATDLRPLVAMNGQPYPVIKTAPSLFLRLDTTLKELSENFDRVTKAFESLLDKQNQVWIKETLQNLDRITHTLAMNSEEINEILKNTAIATRQFKPLLQSSTTTVQMLQNQTIPAAYRTINNLDEVARTLSEIATQIKQNPSILLRGSAPQHLGPGESR